MAAVSCVAVAPCRAVDFFTPCRLILLKGGVLKKVLMLRMVTIMHAAMPMEFFIISAPEALANCQIEWTDRRMDGQTDKVIYRGCFICIKMQENEAFSINAKAFRS